MTQEQQRIAIAEVCGWRGCTDPKCDYRKAMHLHKSGVIAFPESYSIPRFPDYPNDLNAMHEAEKVVSSHADYIVWLYSIAKRDTGSATEWSSLVHATAAQRAEAFLRTLNLYTDTNQ